MTFLDSLIFRSKQLGKDIAKWQQVVNDAPAGHLISRKNVNGKYSYSLSGIKDSNKNERYISKSDRTVAERVALKEYAEKRILDARSEKFALDRYIASLRKDKRADRYLLKHPGAAELVLPQLPGKQDFIQAWIEADYRKSTIYPDKLIYPMVIPGLLVRSKAEGDIISRLVHFGVPFRFEEETVINSVAIHPDLTCLNVRTLKEVYWEHEGQWDRKEYVSRLGSREELYLSANIIPFKNLIITTETRNQPLDIIWVDTLIQHFLL